MPPDLGTKYSVQIERIPPHMSTEDYRLFLRWRTRYANQPTTAYYDVGVGPARPVDRPVDATLRTMWTRLNQKRLDVLLEFEDHWHIVELRDRSNANAIGRLLMYRKLWIEDPPDARDVTMELVTNVTDISLAELARDHQIAYSVV